MDRQEYPHPRLRGQRLARSNCLTVDQLSTEQRSRVMRRVRSKDTRPEMTVRSLVHRLGYRFRLHRKDLPGRPDLVFPARSKVIFVHGCWWHQHRCSRGSRSPKSNQTYWLPKLEKNVRRDRRNIRRLRRDGWSVMVIWECQVSKRNLTALARRIDRFLTK